MSDTQITCLLWGGYSGGNVGDELVLAVALHDAIAEYGADQVAVLTRDVRFSTYQFPGVRMIPYQPRRFAARVYQQLPILLRRLAGRPQGYVAYPPERQGAGTPDEPEWITILRSAQELRLTGGGYLSDHFNQEFALLPVHVARRFGVSITTVPLGLGPFKHSASAALVAKELEGVNVHVRDPDALAIGQDLGLDVELGQDDGFRCFEVIEGLAAAPSSRLRMGINVHPQTGAETDAEDRCTDLVRLFKAWPDIEITGFCFHFNAFLDALSTSRVFRAAGLDTARVGPPHADWRDGVRALAQFDAVVTTRFHATVVAQQLGLAGLALASGTYYHTKMQAASEDAPYLEVVDPAVTTPAEAEAILRRLVEARAAEIGS